MSSTVPQLIRVCAKCSQAIAADALACDRCHALVHAEAVDRIAARARAYEANGDLTSARAEWQRSLPLMPPESEHSRWITAHVQELGASIDSVHGHAGAVKWAKRLAPLGPVALVLAKFKTFFAALLNFKSLFSLMTFFGYAWAVFGWKFGIGFVALIFIHEMGHYIDIRRRGLPAEMPVFLPGLGAYVRWQALGVSLDTRAMVSLAGPMAGLLSAIGCWVWFHVSGDPLARALGHTSAILNALNLIPVWVLDGGQAALAMSKPERMVLGAAGVAIWFFTGQMLFLAVTAGAVFRLFTKDAPEKSNTAVTGYFVMLLASLAWMMIVMPGMGLGMGM